MSVRSAETAGLGRLAGWCYGHRRWVLLMWVAGAVVIIGFSSSIGSAFSNNFSGGNSAAQRAQNLLAARFPAQAGDTADVVIQGTEPLTNPQNAAEVARLVAALRPLAHVSGVQSPLAPGAEHQLSADGRTGFAVVQFDSTSDHLPSASVKRVIDV
ncbi:MAG TPA: hypothetical protein VLX59_14140, partial [Acidimicrobiales bacterium]|nr:hypothetical protein [Acidimicrobiales bacterium]